MRKALFVRHAALGDVLLSFPVIRKFKQLNPGVEIDFLTAFPDVAQSNPDVTSAIDIRKSKLAEIEQNYDEVFCLSYEHLPFLHIIDAYSVSTGIFPVEKKLFFPVANQHIKKTKGLLKALGSKKLLIGLQPFSGLEIKNYPVEKFQTIIDRLKKENPEIEIIVLADRKNILTNCINFGGDFSDLSMSIALIAQCNYFISVDSGLIHFAQAFQIPTVAIFGATTPEFILTNENNSFVVRNESLECLGCFYDRPKKEIAVCKRTDLACMNDLPEQKIIDALHQLMDEKRDEAMKKIYENYSKFLTEYLKNISRDKEKEKARKYYWPILLAYNEKVYSSVLDRIRHLLRLLTRGNFPLLKQILQKRLNRR